MDLLHPASGLAAACHPVTATSATWYNDCLETSHQRLEGPARATKPSDFVPCSGARGRPTSARDSRLFHTTRRLGLSIPRCRRYLCHPQSLSDRLDITLDHYHDVAAMSDFLALAADGRAGGEPRHCHRALANRPVLGAPHLATGDRSAESDRPATRRSQAARACCV